MPAKATGAAAKKKRVQQQKKKAGTAPLKQSPLDDGDIMGFLEDLKVEVDSRCTIIEFEADGKKEELKNVYSNELLKLPKNIRNMSIREFFEKYGGEISSVIDHDKKLILQATGLSPEGTTPSPAFLQSISQTMAKRRSKGGSLHSRTPKLGGQSSSALQMRARAAATAANSSGQIPNSTPMKTGSPGNVFSTPRFDPRLVSTPSTVLQSSKPARQLRRGESIMSVNGSPIVGAPAEGYQSALALILGKDPENLTAEDLNKEETKTNISAIQTELASILERMKK